MSNVDELIYQYVNGDYFAGDAIICLQRAMMLQCPKEATKASMRCLDLARRLEAQKPKDPARKPAPETVVPHSNSSHVTVAPTVATPGWLDKCAESLPEPSAPQLTATASNCAATRSQKTTNKCEIGPIVTDHITFMRKVNGQWRQYHFHTETWGEASSFMAEQATRWQRATPEQIANAGIG